MSSGKLIVVVDDDEGVRASLDQLLRSLGYRTALFVSAESFLSSRDLAVAALIISDVRLPDGMSGIMLLRQLIAQGSSTPVILISSYLDEALVAQAKIAGAYRAMRKPFDADELIRCIESALTHRRRTGKARGSLSRRTGLHARIPRGR